MLENNNLRQNLDDKNIKNNNNKNINHESAARGILEELSKGTNN